MDMTVRFIDMVRAVYSTLSENDNQALRPRQMDGQNNTCVALCYLCKNKLPL